MSTVSSIGRLRRDGDPAPIATRSFMRVVVATRHPAPTASSLALSGMRTSVMNTSLNSASPVIWRSGLTSTPGAVMSRMK